MLISPYIVTMSNFSGALHFPSLAHHRRAAVAAPLPNDILLSSMNFLPVLTTTRPDESFRQLESEIMTELIEDGIFWSESEERRLMPRGFTPLDDLRWLETMNRSQAVAVAEGCGRQHNRLIFFGPEAVKSCVRRRHNLDQIQGEILSFHLARVLGLRNVPPSALASPSNKKMWSAVPPPGGSSAPSHPMVVTQFVEDLEPAFIPPQLQSDQRRLHPVPQDLMTASHERLNDSAIVQLMQWSDLIVFDYLSGNLDRVVNNMYNHQWNPSMMSQAAHNLLRQKGTDLLLFIDNESGLTHGYRLLANYERYHRSLLDSLCIFRRETAGAIERLVKGQKAATLLWRRFARHQQALGTKLPFLSKHNLKTLQNRINTVHNQIQSCKSLYS